MLSSGFWKSLLCILIVSRTTLPVRCILYNGTSSISNLTLVNMGRAKLSIPSSDNYKKSGSFQREEETLESSKNATRRQSYLDISAEFPFPRPHHQHHGHVHGPHTFQNSFEQTGAWESNDWYDDVETKWPGGEKNYRSFQEDVKWHTSPKSPHSLTWWVDDQEGPQKSLVKYVSRDLLPPGTSSALKWDDPEDDTETSTVYPPIYGPPKYSYGLPETTTTLAPSTTTTTTTTTPMPTTTTTTTTTPMTTTTTRRTTTTTRPTTTTTRRTTRRTTTTTTPRPTTTTTTTTTPRPTTTTTTTTTTTPAPTTTTTTTRRTTPPTPQPLIQETQPPFARSLLPPSTYGPPAAYGPTGGYGYGTPSTYSPPGGYGTPSTYGPPGGYDTPSTYNPPGGYNTPSTYSPSGGYGTPATTPAQYWPPATLAPTYGPPSTSAPAYGPPSSSYGPVVTQAPSYISQPIQISINYNGPSEKSVPTYATTTTTQESYRIPAKLTAEFHYYDGAISTTGKPQSQQYSAYGVPGQAQGQPLDEYQYSNRRKIEAENAAETQEFIHRFNANPHHPSQEGAGFGLRGNSAPQNLDPSLYFLPPPFSPSPRPPPPPRLRRARPRSSLWSLLGLN